MRSDVAALGAVLLWASLAAIGVALSEIPPLLTTGVGLISGSLISIFLSKGKFRMLLVPRKTFVIGVVGLFGYHASLFAALQKAPSVQANLINYLWPLLIVVLAPLFLRGYEIRPRHIVSSLVGFSGAALAISTGGIDGSGFAIGYLYALLAALIWATYSLLTKRVALFPTAAVGGFALASGILAIFAHLLFEPQVNPSTAQWLLLLLLGLGPLGGAFYLWDYAIKKGNPQRIGLISFLTPLLSTILLTLTSGAELTWQVGLATILIVGAAVFGTKKEKVNG